MPVLPSRLLEPLWDQFAALLPEHADTHPLGCHNPRVPDRVVFEHVIAALVHGSGYERIASEAVFGPHDPAAAEGLGCPGHRRAGACPSAARL